MPSTSPVEPISDSLKRIIAFIQAIPIFENAGPTTRAPSLVDGTIHLENGVYSQRILFDVKHPGTVTARFAPHPLINIHAQSGLCQIYRLRKLSEENPGGLRLLPEKKMDAILVKFDEQYEAYLYDVVMAVKGEKERYELAGKWDLGEAFTTEDLKKRFIGDLDGR